jgi:hypothetical protein
MLSISISISIIFDKPDQAKVYCHRLKSRHVLVVLNNHVYDCCCPFSKFQINYIKLGDSGVYIKIAYMPNIIPWNYLAFLLTVYSYYFLSATYESFAKSSLSLYAISYCTGSPLYVPIILKLRSIPLCFSRRIS